MARTIKDASLDTRTARGKLDARGKPYYRKLEEGLHLGYRKPRGRKGKPAVSGKWVLRRYVEDQKSKKDKRQPYIVEKIGIADDFDDCDGLAILSFDQAQEEARKRFKKGASDAAGVTGPYTVAVALKDYFEALGHEGRDTYDAQKRADAFIVPALGHIECSKVKAKTVRGWLSALAKKPPRVRTKEGEKEQQHRVDYDPEDSEAIRKRQASANRVLTILKAALNHAFEEGCVSNDVEWRRVKPFKEVDPEQIRFLSLVQSKRLINAAEAEFRPLVRAALLSGCRYGELCRLHIEDFNEDVGTLAIRKSKAKKARTIYLTPEGIRFFQGLAVGRKGRDLLLRHEDGRAWTKSEQNRPIIEASKRAGFVPHFTFNELRHTYGSLLAMAGVPMKVIAESMGHANTMMTEKHYAALAPSHVGDTIRKHLPKFGVPRSNVVTMR
jgi:integrase